jgi:hypothetical protein
MSPSPLVMAACSTRATATYAKNARQDHKDVRYGSQGHGISESVSHAWGLCGRGSGDEYGHVEYGRAATLPNAEIAEPAMEAFRALALLIDDTHQKQFVGAMTDLVEKSLDTTIGHTKMTMEEVSDILLSAAISATNTMDEFREEC